MSKRLFNILAILLLMVYASNTLAMKRANDFGGERSSEWKDAPPEILERIFSDLNLEQNAACALVCSTWHASVGAFGDYQGFKEKFDQLEADFSKNSTLKNAGMVLCHLRGACAELNQRRTKSQEEQTRFVRSFCQNIWGGDEKRTFPELVNKQFTGEELAVRTKDGAKLDIKPVWIYLALIRAFDGRMKESSDSVILDLALIKSLVVFEETAPNWHLTLIMGDGYLITFFQFNWDFEGVLASEYCDRKIEIFKRDKRAFRRGVNVHQFFRCLHNEYAMENTIARLRLPAQSLIEFGLTYYFKSFKNGLDHQSELNVGLFLLAVFRKDRSILDQATGELLYKFAHASCSDDSPEDNIFFCEKALNNDPNGDLYSPVLTRGEDDRASIDEGDSDEDDSDEQESIHRAYLMYHVGESYMRLGNWEKSLEYCECIISSSEDSQDFHDSARMIAAHACGKLKLWEKAAKYFDGLYYPDYPDYRELDWGLMADAYYYSNNWEKAREAYAKYFRACSEGRAGNKASPENYINAAMAFGKSGNEEDVRTAFKYFGMASIGFLEKGAPQEAADCLTQALKIVNINPDLYYQLAIVYAEAGGMIDNVIAALEQAAILHNKNGNYSFEAVCYLKAADYAIKAGRLSEASRFHQQSVEAKNALLLQLAPQVMDVFAGTGL